MSKYDIYLYEESKVLKNLLNIIDESQLDMAEAELSQANMIIKLMGELNKGETEAKAKGWTYISDVEKMLGVSDV